MPELKPPRPGEVRIDLPEGYDAGLYFVGRIRTPWPTPKDCPKNSRERQDVTATVELDPRYAAGLKDIGLLTHLILLYWLHRSPRDFIVQHPRHASEPRGVFALRSPVRRSRVRRERGRERQRHDAWGSSSAIRPLLRVVKVAPQW